MSSTVAGGSAGADTGSVLPAELLAELHNAEAVPPLAEAEGSRVGVTRRALLEELDRPHLKRLPGEPYAFAEWRLRRVGIDYHVEVEAHFYSLIWCSTPSGHGKRVQTWIRNNGQRTDMNP